MITWAQQASSSQKTAAYLASQGCLLHGFIELHRLQFQRRIFSCKEAVKYGKVSGNTTLVVKALTQLGNACYDQGQYREMLLAYQEAKSLMEAVPRALQSKVLMGLGHAYAQHGQAQEALDAISEAHAIFPEEIEDVPAFLSADDGTFSLILFDGWIRLDLGKHYPEQAYNQQAAQALAKIEAMPANRPVPERYRHEIINRRAQAAIALGEREVFCDYTLQSAESLRLMQSEKRRQELVENFKAARKKWPDDRRVLELVDVLL